MKDKKLSLKEKLIIFLCLIVIIIICVIFIFRKTLSNFMKILSLMSKDENVYLVNEVFEIVKNFSMILTNSTSLKFMKGETFYKDVKVMYEFVNCNVSKKLGICIDCVGEIFKEKSNKISLNDKEVDILKYDFYYKSKDNKDVFEKMIKNATTLSSFLASSSITPQIFYLKRMVSDKVIELEDIFDNACLFKIRVESFLKEYKGVLTLMYDKKVNTNRRIPNTAEYRYLTKKFSSKVFSEVDDFGPDLCVSASLNFEDDSVKLLRGELFVNILWKFGLRGCMDILYDIECNGFVFGKRSSLFVDKKTRDVLFHVITSYL